MKHLIKIFLVGSAVVTGNLQSGQNHLYSLTKSPYAATLAHRVGDILSVRVIEVATTVDNGASATDRKNDQAFTLSQLFFPGISPTKGLTKLSGKGDAPGIGFKNNSKFDSSSTNSSNHTLTTKIPVRIIEQVGESQFFVRGQRLLNINGKEKTLSISGVIRQQDISALNEVVSDKIVDAVVEVDGDIVSKELKPGLFTKLYNLIF